MEEKQEAKKAAAIHLQQKFEILKDGSGSGSWRWGAGDVAERAADEAGGSQAFGGGESRAQEGGIESAAFDQRVEKRDELGLKERRG